MYAKISSLGAAALFLSACQSGANLTRADRPVTVDLALREKILSQIKDLHGKSSYTRDLARNQLVIIGEPAVPYLIDALRHESPSLRGYAAYTLGEIGDGRAAQHLVDLLDDSEPEPQKYACRSLGKLGLLGRLEDPVVRGPAGEGVFRHLKNPRADVRMYAADALREMHYLPALPKLLTLTRDPDYKVRIYAMDALGYMTHENFRYDHWRWQEWWVRESQRAEVEGKAVPDVFHIVSSLHRTAEEEEVDRRHYQDMKRTGQDLTAEERYFLYPDPPQSRREYFGTLHQAVDRP